MVLLVLDLDVDELNNDWLKALRLKKEGTKEAEDELKRMAATEIIPYDWYDRVKDIEKEL